MEARNKENHVLSSILILFLAALKLGLISFGVPSAHPIYFQNEYVNKRKWLSHNELVALAPTSSQVGIAIGTLRGGVLGGFA